MSLRWDDGAVAAHAPSSPSAPYLARQTRSTALYQAALLARAQAGDREAFRSLLLTHQSRVYSLALRMLRRREDAQELAQDVFLSLYRSLQSIASPAHLRHWLHRAVCHRAIDRLRSRTAVALLPIEAAVELEGPESAADPSRWRLLRRLIEELRPTPRAVMLLRYQEDLDPAEIARILGLPLNTIKSHLRRSLSRMRQRCRTLQLGGGGGVDD